MEIPSQITYRDAAKNHCLEALIREKAVKLEEIRKEIVSCRIGVEKVQERQRSGRPGRMRIVTRISPDKELVVSRKPGEGDVNEQLENARAPHPAGHAAAGRRPGPDRTPGVEGHAIAGRKHAHGWN